MNTVVGANLNAFQQLTKYDLSIAYGIRECALCYAQVAVLNVTLEALAEPTEFVCLACWSRSRWRKSRRGPTTQEQ